MMSTLCSKQIINSWSTEVSDIWIISSLFFPAHGPESRTMPCLDQQNPLLNQCWLLRHWSKNAFTLGEFNPLVDSARGAESVGLLVHLSPALRADGGVCAPQPDGDGNGPFISMCQRGFATQQTWCAGCSCGSSRSVLRKVDEHLVCFGRDRRGGTGRSGSAVRV